MEVIQDREAESGLAVAGHVEAGPAFAKAAAGKPGVSLSAVALAKEDDPGYNAITGHPLYLER